MFVKFGTLKHFKLNFPLVDMASPQKKNNVFAGSEFHGTNMEKKQSFISQGFRQNRPSLFWAQHLVLSYKCPLKKRPPAVKIWWYSWEPKHRHLRENNKWNNDKTPIFVHEFDQNFNSNDSCFMECCLLKCNEKTYMPKKHHIWVLNLEKPTSWAGGSIC